MSATVTPKLVVCDLDRELLHNRPAEAALLDTWMAWGRGHRPMLLFHSARSIEELQHLLPSSVLPPADFLIGGGRAMLVRHSFWNNDDRDEERGAFAGFAPEHLLASMASGALAQLSIPADPTVKEFPKVESAVLTMAGLSITFAANEKSGRSNGPSVALAWLLAQLQLETTELRTYSTGGHPPLRQLKAV